MTSTPMPAPTTSAPTSAPMMSAPMPAPTTSAPASAPMMSAPMPAPTTSAPASFTMSQRSLKPNVEIPRDNVKPIKDVEDVKEKQRMLFALYRMEKKGVPITEKYSMESPFEKIRDEYTRIRAQHELDSSVKLQRKVLMGLVSGVEYLNTRFDPFDAQLDGWSESIHENLGEYDDVFEELHEKYKERANVPPELKLAMMVGSSAVMYHMTNVFFKSTELPDMGTIFKENPSLRRDFGNAAMNSMANKNEDMRPMAEFMSMAGSGGGGRGNNTVEIQEKTGNRGVMHGPTGLNSILDSIVDAPSTSSSSSNESASQPITTTDTTTKSMKKVDLDATSGVVSINSTDALTIEGILNDDESVETTKRVTTNEQPARKKKSTTSERSSSTSERKKSSRSARNGFTLDI